MRTLPWVLTKENKIVATIDKDGSLYLAPGWTDRTTLEYLITVLRQEPGAFGVQSSLAPQDVELSRHS